MSCADLSIKIHQLGTPPKHDKPAGFNCPTSDRSIELLQATSDSNRVMSDQARKLLDGEIASIVPDASDRQDLYLAMALKMADQGTSPNTEYVGTIELKALKSCVQAQDLAEFIKKFTTLRAFARFYAKVVYNTMRSLNRPPANWIGKGYPPTLRFAAFDFFDGVSDPEAMVPLGGFKFVPSDAEMKINNANKAIMLIRRNQGLTSTLPEVTGGRVPRPTLAIAPAP